MRKSAEILAKRIKEEAEKPGKSLTAIAKAAGLTQPQLSTYISGKHVPNLETLDRLAAALETSPSLLLVDPDEEDPRQIKIKELSRRVVLLQAEEAELESEDESQNNLLEYRGQSSDSDSFDRRDRLFELRTKIQSMLLAIEKLRSLETPFGDSASTALSKRSGQPLSSAIPRAIIDAFRGLDQSQTNRVVNAILPMLTGAVDAVKQSDEVSELDAKPTKKKRNGS